MSAQPNTAPLPHTSYLDTLLDCDAARSGGLVQVSFFDMERHMGWDAFVAEITARKFTAIENRGQIYILCNKSGLRLMA